MSVICLEMTYEVLVADNVIQGDSVEREIWGLTTGALAFKGWEEEEDKLLAKKTLGVAADRGEPREYGIRDRK